MFAALPVDIVDTTCIFFAPPKLNAVMSGKFYKISYSDPSFTMNGIAVDVSMISVETANRSYCKDVVFDTESNTALVASICALENAILTQYMLHIQGYRKCNYGIAAHLNSGIMRLYVNKWIARKSPGTARAILKISGIWDTGSQIGITYKFVDAMRISPDFA